MIAPLLSLMMQVAEAAPTVGPGLAGAAAGAGTSGVIGALFFGSLLKRLERVEFSLGEAREDIALMMGHMGIERPQRRGTRPT